MNRMTFRITTEERNKVREKLITVTDNMAQNDLHLSYPMLKLKRIYVDLTIQLDSDGRFKGVHIKESHKVML